MFLVNPVKSVKLVISVTSLLLCSHICTNFTGPGVPITGPDARQREGIPGPVAELLIILLDLLVFATFGTSLLLDSHILTVFTRPAQK